MESKNINSQNGSTSFDKVQDKSLTTRGFAPVIIILIVVAIIAGGGASYFFVFQKEPKDLTPSDSFTPAENEERVPSEIQPETQRAAPPQPDYYISVDSTPAQTGATVGESATFLAFVRNQGAASKQSSTARLRIDVGLDGSWDTVLQSKSLGSLATNKSARVTWTWKPTTSGDHGWELCADTPSSVAESNEVNNCASGSFTVW